MIIVHADGRKETIRLGACVSGLRIQSLTIDAADYELSMRNPKAFEHWLTDYLMLRFVPPETASPVVVLDLNEIAMQQIRETYVTAFGPLDPNITGNDIDWHICEIIKGAAPKGTEA